MNIEPAILLLVKSVPKYTDITNNLCEWLVANVESGLLAPKNELRRGVSNSIAAILSKKVVPYVFPHALLSSHTGHSNH